jgi:putative ATPase
MKKALQRTTLAYDKEGEDHYNLISALHKSMRGSDVDASLYYLARMLEGGADPLYVARRCIRFASEDVGMKDPNALVQVGYPAFFFFFVPSLLKCCFLPMQNECKGSCRVSGSSVHRPS